MNLLSKCVGYLASIVTLIIISTNLLQAQNTITGKVLENSNKNAIEYATVALYNQENEKLITGVVTQTEGIFNINKLKKGTYKLTVAFMGFETFVKENIQIDGQPLNLGTIYLKEDNQMLQEIEIKGEQLTAVTKVDRQVYDATKFEAAAGGTATDVLKNMPSVSINAEGDLSVRGTSGFVVLLNGKPIQTNAATILNQLPANSIKNVEVITAPSAKYDSEGKAGIINIITTKGATDNLFAQVNVRVGLPSVEPYDNAKMPLRYGGDFTIAQQKNKLNWAIGGSYQRNDKTGRREGDVWTQIDDYPKFRFPSDGERSYVEENYSANLSLGYDATKNTSLHFAAMGGIRDKTRLADIYYNDNRFEGDPTPFQYYNHNSRNRQSDFFVSSFDFDHRFNNGSKIKASVLYEYTLLGGPTFNDNQRDNFSTPENQNFFYLRERNTNENPLNGFRANLDYSFKPSKLGQFEVGYQFRTLDHKGDFLYERENLTDGKPTGNWEVVDNYSSNLNLKRNIHSAYGQLAGEKGDWTYGVGVRTEYMDRQVDFLGYENGQLQPENQREIKKYDYFKLFPSANLQYKVNDGFALKTAYSKRVERTTTFKMNPFKEKEHSETLEQGDADLLPEFIDLVELGATQEIGDHSIFATAYFRNTENLINRTNTFDSDSVLNRIYTNVGNSKVFGFELGTSLKLTKWWDFYAGGNVYHQHIKGQFNYNDTDNDWLISIPVDTKAWQYSFNINTTFDITKTLSTNFSFNYLSERVTAQGRDSRFYSPNLSIKKTFLDKRLAVNFQWLNMDMGMLNTNEQRITTSGDYNALLTNGTSQRQQFYTTTNYVYEVDQLIINITYNFNSSKNKSKKVKSEFGAQEF
ncbi:TonB-dependent receptor [Flammeovirga yaeyamensis]|uniref:TonB-dependent receptor n=1 Tax=Flammeovirga yaeyamensis TaxID=367791 RepID=A0AAX1N9X8_9BACT|nr:TonB-dependent receptor [Flammeovirga yaeyamensis]MBB3699276.1 outer membrane receptor protein involved in Fe transport [Flammeovirga yaeyamensis]NMF35461.1 TonB-dependent receptor [Flammeovirga yaeyamensis]QWG04321.1 TonB-dependent receptor [Flammeovirga yaeyamensis]